jgi:hypothetical protein
MYTIIKNPRMMTRDEIVQLYNGYWVYVVNAEIDTHGTLMRGMPVVLGKYQFAGVDEGIYKQFDGEEYGRDLSYNLLPNSNTISSVFGIGH